MSINGPMPIPQSSLAFPGHCLVSEYEATLHKDVWPSVPHNIQATVSFAQCVDNRLLLNSMELPMGVRSA